MIALIKGIARFLGSELPEAVTHNEQVAMLQQLVDFERSRADAFHCALDQKATVFDDQAEIMNRFGQTTDKVNIQQLVVYWNNLRFLVRDNSTAFTRDQTKKVLVKIMGSSLAGLYSLGVDPAEAWDEAYDTNALVIIPYEPGHEEGPE